VLWTVANLRGIPRSAQYPSRRLLGHGTSEESAEWCMYSEGVDTLTPVRMFEAFLAVALLVGRT
jgi:hypothetical protein